jgi:hypothetical protein
VDASFFSFIWIDLRIAGDVTRAAGQPVARAAPEHANEQWKWMVWMWFNEVKWFYFNNP